MRPTSFLRLVSLPPLAASSLAAPRTTPGPLLAIRTLNDWVQHGISNVYLDWGEGAHRDLHGSRLRVTVDDCQGEQSGQGDEVIAETILSAMQGPPDRLVWIVEPHLPPQSCLSAWVQGERVARSLPVLVKRNLKTERRKWKQDKLLRKRAQEGSLMEDFDTTGLWFDGLAHVKARGNASAFGTRAKETRIAIVGAGMSGLMTSLLLDSVGLNNYSIIEASQRFGGRVRTEYFDPDPAKYQYVEMGPMRFPRELTLISTNETVHIKDHDLVFQLVDELNRANAGNDNLTVRFIPWYQTTDAVLRYFSGFKVNGLPPNVAQLQANSSLVPTAQLSSQYVRGKEFIRNLTTAEAVQKSVAENIFRAHRDALLDGLDDFSEFGYLQHKLGLDLDTTDMLAAGFPGSSSSYWYRRYTNTWFLATKWSTIDKGLNRLSEAFWGTPAANRTIFGRKIFKVDNEADGRVRLHWKPNNTASVREAQSESFDYAFISAPFSVVKYWRMPNVNDRMLRAIQHLQYTSACKVGIQFSRRFWEQPPFDPPILGGCSSTDLPAIDAVCYPPYKLNSTGPAVVLAAYVSNTDGLRLASWSEETYVAHALDAFAEMHGDVAYETFISGKAHCWSRDEFTSASWARPAAGEHRLFIPEYYKNHNSTIFIGEHTSFTHAWIASALESAVRGTVQLLLELGLVDEAKNVTQTWMGRWIDV